MNRGYLIGIIIFFILCNTIHCQVTEIQIDKKDFASIKLSTHNGLDIIPLNYYENRDSLFFLISLKDNDNFSKSLIKEIYNLKIEQFSKTTKCGPVLTVENNSGKIGKLIVPYAKKELEVYRPFEFIFQLYRSNPIQIPEEQWPRHTEFISIYENGKDLYEEQKYIEAFRELQYIIPGGSKNHMYYIRFSSYNQIYEVLIPDIIEKIQVLFKESLDRNKSRFGSLENINNTQLELVKAMNDSIHHLRDLIDIYYIITEPTNLTLKDKHEDLQSKSSTFYEKVYEIWKKTKLKIFEDGNYSRRNKFSVYTGLLSRLLCYKVNLKSLSKLDSINLSYLDGDISFIRSYLDDLNLMEWQEEFSIILNILNEEISNNERLFSQNYFLNFKANISNELQPNNYILNAFNELARDNKETFRENIQLAISKCTDKDLLFFLELWMNSYQLYRKGKEPEVLKNINTGLENEANFLPNEAFTFYDKAGRLDATFALPPFLIGRIKLKNENNYIAAERYFNEAINLNPSFVLARIFRLEILIKNGRYQDVLSEITSALQNPNLQTWYIYFLKARVHFLLNENSTAIELIKNTCIALNKNNFEQFLLLGDISINLKDCNSAREYYQQAGNINPDSPDYNQRMQNLINLCNQ